MSNSINVGKIVNTHGLKGEVKVYPYTNTKERFGEFDHVFFDENLTEKFKITSVRYQKNMCIVKFKSFNHINEVEKFKDTLLYIDREEQGHDLEEDEFYITDLIGLEVVDNEKGLVGKVEDVIQNRAHDIFLINCDGQQIMIPYVDEFIEEIDMEAGVIRVKLIEGLI